MAKFECIIPNTYDFDTVLNYFQDYLSDCGISVSFEHGSDYRSDTFRIAVRVYERYSLMGDNRISLNVVLASSGAETFASAITAAGGRGIAKVVGWGEDSFLECFINAAKMFEGMIPRGRNIR